MSENNLFDEKIALLNEIHHRVKNNFQIIISLVELQIVRHPENKQEFVDLINRIKSMSLTYETLLLADNAAYIKFGEYIQVLIDNIKTVCENDIEFIVENDNDELLLNLEQATPAGIAINELITNACRHAFVGKKNKPKIVKVILSENYGKVQLHINDNGVGINQKFLKKDSTTLGLNLVKMLIKEQLEGSLYIKNEYGTKVFINFKKM